MSYMKQDRYRSINEQVAGRNIRLRLAKCDCCGVEEQITQNGHAYPPEFIAKKLRQIGWRIDAKDTCPQCVALQASKEPVMAEPPRTPTAEDRRRIRDALDKHYQEDKGRYAKAFSDKSVAASLSVPAKWVADLREAMGLGDDVNETAAQEAAELKALKAEMDKVSDEFMSKMSGFESRIKKLEVGRSYAAA